MSTSGSDHLVGDEPTPIRIRITNDGRIQALWTDAVDFTALGPVVVRRASHVEFNERGQCWEVREAETRGVLRHCLQWLLRRPMGCVLFQTRTRAEALAWETRHFGPGGAMWNRPAK